MINLDLVKKFLYETHKGNFKIIEEKEEYWLIQRKEDDKIFSLYNSNNNNGWRLAFDDKNISLTSIFQLECETSMEVLG